jgi:hypothetical protein
LVDQIAKRKQVVQAIRDRAVRQADAQGMAP